jgi:Fe-S-cluster containining protein
MTKNQQQLLYLRQHIPAFECTPGCHDCCGPVTTSAEEMARLPRKSDAHRDQALAEFNCPHLGEHGCEAYQERPLICRLFGTTAQLPCPNGKGPSKQTDVKIEKQVHQFLQQTRQVLV